MDIRRQTYQNERLYTKFDYETGKELGDWDQASNSRKVKFLCEHGGRQNNASPMHYNLARDQNPQHTTTAPSPRCADREECVERLRSAMEIMEAGKTERALEQVEMVPIMPPPRPQPPSLEAETSVYHDQMEEFMAQEAGEEDVRFRRRSFGDLESFEDFHPSRSYAVPLPMTEWPIPAPTLATSVRCDRTSGDGAKSRVEATRRIWWLMPTFKTKKMKTES